MKLKFTRATQLAFQSAMLALLALVAAVLGTIESAPDVIQGASAGAAVVLLVASFCSTVAFLFISDQEIEHDAG